MDQYFEDEPMDDLLNKMLMTFAAYNAGPGRLRQLSGETKKRGLDPNLWFNNVERAASEWIGLDGHVRQQHRQVLHHLPPGQRSTRST